MDRARSAGVIICIISVVIALLITIGIFSRSYWAIAIPVLVGVLGVMGLAFWIGWTMATTEIETPTPTRTPEDRPTSTTTDTTT
jgi:hypothetical protein